MIHAVAYEERMSCKVTFAMFMSGQWGSVMASSCRQKPVAIQVLHSDRLGAPRTWAQVQTCKQLTFEWRRTRVHRDAREQGLEHSDALAHDVGIDQGRLERVRPPACEGMDGCKNVTGYSYVKLGGKRAWRQVSHGTSCANS